MSLLKVKTISRIALFLLAPLSLGSFTELFTELDNEADPKLSEYRGYPTVGDPAAVKPAELDAGILAYAPTLVSVQVSEAQAYRFQIAANTDFSTIVHTSDESPSNEFLPSACPALSSATIYY